MHMHQVARRMVASSVFLSTRSHIRLYVFLYMLLVFQLSISLSGAVCISKRKNIMGEVESVQLLCGFDPDDQSSSAIEEFLEQGENIPAKVWAKLVVWESKILWYLSGASIIVMVLNFMLSMATQMFVGHLGALELAGASMASVGIQGLAYGIMLGMSSAVQTVCGQAYGAKKYGSLGIICQKAIILHLGAAVLLSVLYWFSSPILHAIGQSEAIAKEGQVFARGLIPQLYAFALYCPVQRFLQAQNIVNPLAYFSVGVFIVHVFFTWLVVDVFKYGLLGSALTLSLSWWILALLTIAYAVLSPSTNETWTGLSFKALDGLPAYAKLTAASAVMLWLEIWYSQGIVLISGLLPNPTVALDSISICMNYLNLDMQFMLGISVGASIRVGNELGACHPKLTKFSVIVVNMTSILISLILSALVLILRTILSEAFTSDDVVINAVSELTPFLAVSVFLNGIQPILSGVAIGSGWQAFVAYVNVACYYIVGLPIGCIIGFKTSLGVTGIWIGLILGVFLQTVALIILTCRTKWDKEVEKAHERVKKSADEETVALLAGTA